MLDRLDELIRADMERERIPGLALALVRGDEVVDVRTHGVADRETGSPVTPRTTFGAASITKPVLATALLRHVEAGRADLDAPIDSLLAPIRFENPFPEPVTLRRLLTHTAGLPVGNLPADAAAKSLAEAVAAGARAVEPPGTRIVYANWGYDTLAHVLGGLAGRPWHREVEQTVLRPLGMSRSTFGTVPEAMGYHVSKVDGGLHRSPQAAAPWDPPSGAGSLVASVEDVARFVSAQLAGGRAVLGPEILADMHRTSARSGATDTGMGLGFRTDRLGGHRLIMHGGDGQGTTHLIAALPERGVGVALLTNVSGAQTARTRIPLEALRALLGEDLDAGPRGSGAALPGGRYRSNFWDIELDVAVEGGRTVLRPRRGLTLSQAAEPCELEPLTDDRMSARGGMFHGLELRLEAGDPPRLHGGVYPYSFERLGPLEPEAPLDPEADLSGAWSGTCDSPVGPLPLALRLEGAAGHVSLLSLQDAPVDEFRAERGRVEGRVEVELAPFGAMTLYLRLESRGGDLTGAIHARGGFGEIELPLRLRRA